MDTMTGQRVEVEQSTMVVGLLADIPVKIESALFGRVFITSLGRENLGIHWIGGEGYKGSPSTTVEISCIGASTEIATTCPEFVAWQEAIQTTDRMADNHHVDTLAAYDAEETARAAFVAYIRNHNQRR